MPTIDEISPDELDRLLRDDQWGGLLLDVRQPDEYEICRLRPALLLPLNQLAARIEEISVYKNKAVVVYCHHGSRSARAIQYLQSQGFTHLQNLHGGIDAWSLHVDSSVPRY